VRARLAHRPVDPLRSCGSAQIAERSTTRRAVSAPVPPAWVRCRA
jgi:hypothetical protein